MRRSLPALAGSLVIGLLQPSVAGELYDATLAGKQDEVARLLAAGADVNDEGDLGTALHVAAFQGNAATVTLLLNKGADIEKVKTSLGDHPLHVAVDYNQPEVVALLLARGAKVDAREASGRTPLHVAAGKDNVEIAKLLLESGADVNATFRAAKVTALHVASYRGKKDMVALLLAYHADVNASADGETALLNAAEKGSPELVELLLSNGANINVRSKEGLTPLMLARSNFDKGVAEVLVHHGETE